MSNSEIIIKTAITYGIYTEEQIQGFIENGEEIPFHTLQGWSQRGFKIKKDEHGYETKLWKSKEKKNKKNNDSEKPCMQFYLAKAFLFTREQVEAA